MPFYFSWPWLFCSILVACICLAVLWHRRRGTCVVISQLYIFPIKSCAGISVQSARIERRGLVGDRTFMLVSLEAPNGEGAKASNHHIARNPVNILIQPRIEGDTLVVTSPNNAEPFRCPFQPCAALTAQLTRIAIDMHQSPTVGLDMGAEAEAWFSLACGIPNTKLVFLPAPNHRPVLGNILPDGHKDGLTFTDCASIAFGSAASLRQMSELLGRPMDPRPLRLNVWMDSHEKPLEPWAEDFWSRLESVARPKLRFDLTGNIARCVSIDVDCATGIRQASKGQKTPLKSIMGTRRVDKGMRFSPIFGRYGFNRNTQGEVSVGQVFRITGKNKTRTTFEWPGLSY